MKDMKEKEVRVLKENEAQSDKKPAGVSSSEWATEALEELDEFIESQGIYIRQ